MKVKVLFATKKGEPDYMEQLITDKSEAINEASKWALVNGFDRLRIATIDLGKKPDFTKTINL